MDYLTIGLALSTFAATRLVNLRGALICMGLQALLTILVGLVAATAHEVGSLAYIFSGCSCLFKVVLIPGLLWRRLRQQGKSFSAAKTWPDNYLTGLCGGAFVIGYVVINQFLPFAAGRNLFAVSVAMILTGMSIMAGRQSHILQGTGLVMLANGVFLSGAFLWEGSVVLLRLQCIFDALLTLTVLGFLPTAARVAQLWPQAEPVTKKGVPTSWR